MTAPDTSLPGPDYPAHARAMLWLGLPLVGSHLAQFAVQLTDTVMMGWYGVEELAALVLAGSFFYVIFLLGSGFAWAVMPLVASAAGTADDTQVRRATRMGLWLSAGFGLASMPAMIWSEPLLLALGQDPGVSALAEDYLRIAAWGMAPSLVIMVLKSYLAALGRTQVVLWVMVGSAVLNGFLNYALIFGNWGAPELGIEGAAIASVTLQVVGLAALVIYAIRATPDYAIFHRIWRIDTEALARVFRLGWPIGLTSLAEVGLFTASALMMGWIGTIELAAHGIALNLAATAFMVHLGLSNAATILAGQAYGQRDEARLRQGGIVAIALSAAIALLTVLAFLLLPEPLIALFLDPADPDRAAILAVGVGLLAVAALFQFADGAQVMALGLLRGVQDTRVPMIMASLSYWVIGIPASYVLGFTLGLGGIGVWAGLVIGLVAAGGLLMWRFWTRAVRIAGAS